MIAFRNVVKRYADGTTAVTGRSLTAPAGKLTVLVGPSSCGKTTSLRKVNRLIAPTEGTVLLDDEPTERITVVKIRRRIGSVIQHAGQLPHRTALQNIATTARLNGVAKTTALRTARDLLGGSRPPDGFADRFPGSFPCGQQQRVGVAPARVQPEIHADGRALR